MKGYFSSCILFASDPKNHIVDAVGRLGLHIQLQVVDLKSTDLSPYTYLLLQLENSWLLDLEFSLELRSDSQIILQNFPLVTLFLRTDSRLALSYPISQFHVLLLSLVQPLRFVILVSDFGVVDIDSTTSKYGGIVECLMGPCVVWRLSDIQDTTEVIRTLES